MKTENKQINVKISEESHKKFTEEIKEANVTIQDLVPLLIEKGIIERKLAKIDRPNKLDSQ